MKSRQSRQKPAPPARQARPRRRLRLAIIALALAALAAAGVGWQYSRRSRGQAEGIRNVVLISIDTCRADRLSCYGYGLASTPNIDALAREGVLFRNAMTCVPLTTAAHSSMLTGTYPPTHGVRSNGARLAESNETLAAALKQAGYQTAAFVGGFPLDARFGLNRGFDTYDDQFTRKTMGLPNVTERRAEEVNRPALTWLSEHAARPFFLFLHYYDPHEPYEPPPPYSTSFADDPYAGEIAYVDHCVGQVIDRLRAAGAYDNTLVIVTGDHGEGRGDHGERAHSFFVYQSTMHVPLVIRSPGGARGAQVEGPVSLVDVVPTVLDLAGLKTPPRVQGVSLRPSLDGQAQPQRKQPLYCESLEPAQFGWSPLNAVVEGPWKYIRSPRSELYDLKHDPAEATNLAPRESGVARRLQGRLEGLLRQMESVAARPDGSAVDAQALKQLQGLGYVGAGAAPPVSAFDPTLDDPKDVLPVYERLEKVNNLILANRGPEAAKELLALLADHPRLIMAHAMLADIAAREGRWADAAERCDSIVALLSQSKVSTKTLFADQEDFTAGKLNTRDLAAAHFNLATMLTRQGKSDQANGHLEQALRLRLQARPGDHELHNNLGSLLRQTGRPREALEQYEEALRIKPGYAEAHFNLALLAAEAGELPVAAGHYRQALRIKPDLLPAINNLAWLLATQEDPAARNGAEAVGLAEHACRLTGRKEFGLLDTLAAAYAQAGRFPEAVATAQEAQALARPADPAAAEDIQSRLILYRAARPYREASRKSPPAASLPARP